VLSALMFKRYTEGCGVAIEFHPISGPVDQPLGAGLREGVLEQLAKELSADSLP